MKKNHLLAIILQLLVLNVFANNITVSNAVISNQNIINHSSLINFNVAWDNSWRTSTNENNYDGAWIFVKYRKNGTTDWRHCTINVTGNTAATGGTITVPTDGKGAYIYRSANGIGNISFSGNKIQWNYGADGLLDNETVEIRVFALEMVYVPAGNFYLGSGSSIELNSFKNGPSSAPYLVNTGAITTGTIAGTLNFNGKGTGTSIPAAFPTGYNAFWLMKYECSQQQYADFLNHLDLARANFLKTPYTSFTGTHPNLVPISPDKAITTVGYIATTSLADWSGLRPFTELEFEKACRGYNTPAVPNEFAWGNTTYVGVTAIVDDNLPGEAVSTPLNANANIDGLGSITRVGIFARPSGSDRTLSGGTYYGIMNMSDNVKEIVVYAGSIEGRSIVAATRGDGYLDAVGKTDIPTWLLSPAFGFRGSGIYDSPDRGKVSDRGYADFFTPYTSDNSGAGSTIRLARTAP